MIGIKGSGMSALALVLKGLGHDVSGSDYTKFMFTEDELKNNKIKIYKFSKSNLDNIDLVVVGHNFIDSDNEELLEAKKRNIRVLEYNECLGKIIENYYSIGVCGSNGKTTTTGLIGTILDNIENTTYLIGSGEGKGNKNSKYFTFEACEYKRHFLKYFPNLILVNNIDYDHVDYFLTKEDYIRAFYEFIDNSKDKVIVNGDNEYLKDLDGVIFFGIENKKMFNARNINYNKGIDYDLYYKDEFLRHIHLDHYGEYMVYDSLAAMSVCISLGLDIDVVVSSLKKFNGVKRRFKETIIDDDVYIDDYAHHPSKIKAIIEAIKSKYKDKKIIAFYRPDRVSRLDYFSKEFAKELMKVNKAYILPFINNGDEEKECINRFLNNNPKIKLANEKTYIKVSKEKGVVYLMMSSKDVSEVKEKILRYKGD